MKEGSETTNIATVSEYKPTSQGLSPLISSGRVGATFLTNLDTKNQDQLKFSLID